MKLRDMADLVRTQPLKYQRSELRIMTKKGERIRCVFGGFGCTGPLLESLKKGDHEAIPTDCEEGELRFWRMPLVQNAPSETIPLADLANVQFFAEILAIN